MKKILCIFLAVLLITGTAFAATPGFRLSPGIGRIETNQGGLQSDPVRIFRMVRYIPYTGVDANKATLSDDCIVIWDTTSDDCVTVTTTATSHDSSVAGVMATSALTPDSGTSQLTAFQAIGRRNWAWLQTHGKTDLKCAVAASGKLAVKSMFSTSTTHGYAGAFSLDNTIMGVEGTGVNSLTGSTLWGMAGFMLDAPAAVTQGTEAEAYVRLQ